MIKERGYRFFDHTADIGMSVYGNDLKELFANAAKGMFDIIGDGAKFKPLIRKEIDIDGSDVEELLHKWLATLIFHFDSDKLFLTEFKISEISDRHLMAEVLGESYLDKKGYLDREIKAVTYHQMEVKKDEKGWQVKVIFDI